MSADETAESQEKRRRRSVGFDESASATARFYEASVKKELRGLV